MSNENRVYQISCPNCHHEWSYSGNYYSQKIKQLGHDIEEINNQISKIKSFQDAKEIRSGKKVLLKQKI